MISTGSQVVNQSSRSGLPNDLSSAFTRLMISSTKEERHLEVEEDQPIPSRVDRECVAELRAELIPGNSKRVKFSPANNASGRSSSSSPSSSSTLSDSSLKDAATRGRVRFPNVTSDVAHSSGGSALIGAIELGRRAAEELIQQISNRSGGVAASNGKEHSLLTDEIELEDTESGSDELEFLPTIQGTASKSNGFMGSVGDRSLLGSVLRTLTFCRCRPEHIPRCEIISRHPDLTS